MRKTAANLSVVLSFYFAPTEHFRSTVISQFLHIWEKVIELK